MDRYIVYKHTSPNGKVYIGITKRRARDRWKYGHGYKHNAHFYSAIIKYGWNNIEHQIIASNLSLEEASNLEKELISLYTKQGICYNVAEGGQDGNKMKRTAEEKEHLSQCLKEYYKTHIHPLKGKKHSPDSIEKMKAAQKRRWQVRYDETYKCAVATVHVGVFNIITREYLEFDSEKEAMAALDIKGTTFRRHVNNGSLYKNYIFFPLNRFSFEEAMLRSYNREKQNIHCGGQEKAVVQLTIHGDYVNTYCSVKQAAIETKIVESGIGKACRGQVKYSGGYCWKFKTDYTQFN